MTDKQFLKLIEKSSKLMSQARDVVRKCEDEYNNRFGSYPSDIDNEGWIDNVQYGNGTYTSIDDVIEDHNFTIRNKQY